MSTDPIPTELAEARSPRPDHRTARTRATVVATALAVAAVAAAVNLLARPLPADDVESYAAVEPLRDAVWVFAVVGGVAFAVTYLTVGIAGCMLVPNRGATLATVGAVFTGFGGVLFGAGFLSFGVRDWYLTADAVTGDAGPALFEYAQDNGVRSFGIQAAGFGLSFVGLLLIAVALWRAGSVPRWLPIAIPVAFVVMVLSGTGVVYDVLHAVFMATLVALAWHLWRGQATGRRIPSST